MSGEKLGSRGQQVRVLGGGHESDDRSPEEWERGLDRGEIRVEREREVQDSAVGVAERRMPDVDEHVGIFGREIAGSVARVTVERDCKAPGLESKGERDAPAAEAVGELERDGARAAPGEFGSERPGVDIEGIRGRARSPSRSP
jgi:hypothetical protein